MKFLILALTSFLISVDAFSMICGEDDRVPAFDSRIGRIKLNHLDSGCTATMISKNCALSAGHCLNHMKTLEFNVPLSIRGRPQFAAPQDVYVIDQSSIVYKEKRPSTDWAVFKIKKNMMTGLSAGEAYGYFPVNFQSPQVGEELMISGYGRDSRGDGSYNFTLQTDHGKLVAVKSLIFGKALHYRIDSTGGTSGSAVIRVKEQDIVGIHTHGGCDSIENHGTIISEQPELIEAIKACIRSDK
jgi:V8-like Glu-specific endopeptidase